MKTIIFFTIIGFLSGSIMYSYLIPKYLFDTDIRLNAKDHNPGTANVVKQCGIIPGLLCLLLDLLKGFVPIYFACKQLDTSNILFSFVLAAPVAGHAFSPFLYGKGGKAIATTFGCTLGAIKTSPIVLILAALFIFFSTIVRIHPHQYRVVITFILLILFTFFISMNSGLQYGTIGICLIVIGKHLSGLKEQSLSLTLPRIDKLKKNWVSK